MSLPDFLMFTRKKRVPATPPINPEDGETRGLLARVGEASDAATPPKPAGADSDGQSLGEMGVASMMRHLEAQRGRRMNRAAAPVERAKSYQLPAEAQPAGDERPKFAELPGAAKADAPSGPTVDTRGMLAPRMTTPDGDTLAAEGLRRELRPVERRARIADPAAKLEADIDAARTKPAQDDNGRLKSILATMGHNALMGLARGGVGGAVGGALFGAAQGAVDPATDERIAQGKTVAGWQSRLAEYNAREDAKLNREAKRADIGVKRANEWWLKQKPGVEEAKQKAAALKREQQVILSTLRLRKRPFDVNNPHDVATIERAERAGINADWESFGLDTKNPYTLEVIDPDDATGTKKTRLVYNRQTRQWEDLGYTTGYAQPVGADGMTAYQRNTFGLSQDKFEETQRMNAVRAEGIRTRIEKMEQEMSGVTSADKRAFDVATKGLFEAIKSKRAEIERWEKLGKEHRIDPTAAREQIEAIDRDIKALEAQVSEARTKALGGSGSRPRAGGAAPARTYTEADVRSEAKRMGKDQDAAVKAARAAGLIR